MANNNESGLLKDLGITAKEIDDKSFENFPRGAWKSIKTMWGENLSRIVIMSFIALIFFSPAIAWIIISATLAGNVTTAIPYNLFDFIGYPSPSATVAGLTTAETVGAVKFFQNAMLRYSVLIPCISFAAIGIGGLFYVARIFAHKDISKNMFKGFFVGVRYTFLPALVLGFIEGAAIFLFMFSLYVFDAFALGVVGKVFALIGSSLILVFASLLLFNALSLASTYKMPLSAIIKDSLSLVVGSLAKELIFMFFVALGIGLMVLAKFFLSSFYTLMWTLMFMLGIFFYISLFAALSHTYFDLHINSETANRTKAAIKEKEMAARERNRQERLEKKAAGESKKPKSQPTKFVNPKKKKKQEVEEPLKEEKKVSPFAFVNKQQTNGYSEKELAQIEEDRKAVLSAPSEDDGFDASAYEDTED